MSVCSLRRSRRTTTTHTAHRDMRRTETGTWGSERTDGRKTAPKHTRAKMQSTSCQFQWMAAYSNLCARNNPRSAKDCKQDHVNYTLFLCLYIYSIYIHTVYLSFVSKWECKKRFFKDCYCIVLNKYKYFDIAFEFLFYLKTSKSKYTAYKGYCITTHTVYLGCT